MTAHLFHNTPLPFTAAPGGTTITLLPLTEDGYRQWLATQPEHVANQALSRSFEGKSRQTCLIFNTGAAETILIGLGQKPVAGDFCALPDFLRASFPAKNQAVTFALQPDGLSAEEQNQFCIDWALGCYEFRVYKTTPARPAPILVWPEAANRERVTTLVEAICLTRDLVNTPANDMGPVELAAAAHALATHHGADYTEILDKDLLDQNFPMIYAVGNGSTRRPRLIDINWGDEKAPLLTLVGKGVCFDTGGLDIKPSAFMLTMKKDMGGAAHALGLAHMIMTLKLPVRLRVLIPAVENSISGDAFRPSDILKTRKGITVEVGDTDAEGRLVLGDSLTYACERNPDLILDFATLTGAARVALGTDIPVFFTNRDEFEPLLRDLSARAEDPVWRLPLWQPYKKEMESPVADLSSVGSGKAGCIHAALFLENFVSPQTNWVHFDIYAWEDKGRPGRPRGGADTGLRAALAFIEQRYKA